LNILVPYFYFYLSVVAVECRTGALRARLGVTRQNRGHNSWLRENSSDHVCVCVCVCVCDRETYRKREGGREREIIRVETSFCVRIYYNICLYLYICIVYNPRQVNLRMYCSYGDSCSLQWLLLHGVRIYGLVMIILYERQIDKSQKYSKNGFIHHQYYDRLEQLIDRRPRLRDRL